MQNIVILSGGGIKSAVCAWRYAKDNELTLVHLSFGQPASTAELNATGELAKRLPHAALIPLVLPHVTSLQRGGEDGVSSVGAAGVVGTPSNNPEVDALSPVMLAAIAPMMLSVGVQVALRVGSSTVVTGLTQSAEGAHLGLPSPDPQTDNRREMLHGLSIAFDALLPAKSRVKIETPLMDLGYAEIVQLAVRFDLSLEQCWTCCASSTLPCTQCQQCKARSQAFTQARSIDPATTTVPTR